MKHIYKVSVLPECGGDSSRDFVVMSDAPIENRLLIAAGIILDGGCPPDDVEPAYQTGLSYVQVVEMDAG